jgi:hypothetical protein
VLCKFFGAQNKKTKTQMVNKIAEAIKGAPGKYISELCLEN